MKFDKTTRTVAEEILNKVISYNNFEVVKNMEFHTDKTLHREQRYGIYGFIHLDGKKYSVSHEWLIADSVLKFNDEDVLKELEQIRNHYTVIMEPNFVVEDLAKKTFDVLLRDNGERAVLYERLTFDMYPNSIVSHFFYRNADGVKEITFKYSPTHYDTGHYFNLMSKEFSELFIDRVTQFYQSYIINKYQSDEKSTRVRNS